MGIIIWSYKYGSPHISLIVLRDGYEDELLFKNLLKTQHHYKSISIIDTFSDVVLFKARISRSINATIKEKC